MGKCIAVSSASRNKSNLTIGHRRRLQGGAALLSLAALAVGSPVDQVVFQHSRGGKGAVASESRVCSQIGIDLLELGVSVL